MSGPVPLSSSIRPSAFDPKRTHHLHEPNDWLRLVRRAWHTPGSAAASSANSAGKAVVPGLKGVTRNTGQRGQGAHGEHKAAGQERFDVRAGGVQQRGSAVRHSRGRR